MTFMLTNTNKSTDIYKVDNYNATLYKNLCQANATCTAKQNFVAFTTENNIIQIVKIINNDVQQICTLQLKDDVKQMKFSPLCSHLQVNTFAGKDSNVFIYSVEPQSKLLFETHKVIDKTTNIEHQPYLVQYNADQSVIICQNKNKIVYYDSNFMETYQFDFYPDNIKYFIQLHYFQLNNYQIISNVVIKNTQAKIAVYQDKQFLFGYTNQKASKFTYFEGNYYFAVKLQFDDSNAVNYYGNSQLLLFNLVQKKYQILVKEYLNTCCIFKPSNNLNTETIVTSSGNPCLLQFNYITYQKASNSLIVKTVDYKHKVHINASCTNGDVLVLRGEAGMDGDVYTCVWSQNQVKIIAHKKQRDITHVNISNNLVVFSTQRPRFQIDNSFYINDHLLEKQQKTDLEGIRYLHVVDADQITVKDVEKLKEVEIENGDVEQQTQSKKAEAYVPPQLRAKQQQQQQSSQPSTRGGWF